MGLSVKSIVVCQSDRGVVNKTCRLLKIICSYTCESLHIAPMGMENGFPVIKKAFS